MIQSWSKMREKNENCDFVWEFIIIKLFHVCIWHAIANAYLTLLQYLNSSHLFEHVVR